MEGKVKVKALYVEKIVICHQHNLTTLSNKYVRLEVFLPAGQKMQLFPVKNKTKSDHSNKKLMKDLLC